MSKLPSIAFATVLFSTLIFLCNVAAATEYAGIQIVDQKTGRGVPLVELTTVNKTKYITDSNGYVAINDPDLMGQTVYFHIKSHGYTFPTDGFGNSGFRAKLAPRHVHVVKLQRVNIAERLYRITGQGIYRDTVLLGKQAPGNNSQLNGGVFGQDSVVNAIYRGKLFWFWGDTDRASYALGNYQVTGAVSALPSDGGLDPAVGVALDYFENGKGFTKQLCPIEGPGPVWIFGAMVVDDDSGKPTLVTHYQKMKSLGQRISHGIAIWDDDAQMFVPHVEFPQDAPLYPSSSATKVMHGTEAYYYFPHPYPNVRVRARLADVLDYTRYEAFTPLVAGSRDQAQIERDADGRAKWAWKADTAAARVSTGVFELGRNIGNSDQGMYHLSDLETGKPIRGHWGSINWNAFKKKWVMLAVESYGTSPLGEVWFAEADSILGPWVYARKIITHDNYSFYNVKQHPYFDQEDGRLIYLEGTYTKFITKSEPTPRYDYNQIMYRLDLADDRLSLPRPVFAFADENSEKVYTTDARRAPIDASVPFYAMTDVDNKDNWVALTMEGQTLAFGVKSDTATERNAALIPLYKFNSADGRHTLYSTSQNLPSDKWVGGELICHVWKSPNTRPHRMSN